MPTVNPIFNDDALSNSREKSVPNINVEASDPETNKFLWESRATETHRINSTIAAFQLARQDNFIESFLKGRELEKVQEEAKHNNEELVDPDELNKLFPVMRSKFNEPMPMSVAQHIANYNQARQEYEEVISRAPDDFLSKGLLFGAGLGAAAMDPVALGASMLTGGAVGLLATSKRFVTMAKVAKALSKARSYERTGPIISAKLFKAAGAASVEGAVANAFIEPMTFSAKDSYLEDYTAADAFTNIVVGGLAEGTIRFGGGIIHGALSKRPLAKAVVFADTKQQIDLDINAEPNFHVARKIENETNVRAVPGDQSLAIDSEYVFKKATKDDLNSKTFYIANNGSEVKPDTSAVLGNDFGDAVYMTDDGFKANGAATSEFNDSSLLIKEVQIASKKSLDLDEALPTKVIDSLKESLPNQTKNIDFTKKGLDVLEDIKAAAGKSSNPDKVVADMVDAIKKSDVEVMHYTHNKTAFKEPHDPHNVAVLLNEKSLVEKRNIESTNKVTVEKLADVKPDRLSDPKYRMDFDEAQKQASDALYKDLKELPTTVREARTELEEMITAETERAQALPDGPEKEEILKSLAEDQAALKVRQEAFKANEFCRKGF